MKRITIFLTAALALCAMAGCGKQTDTQATTEAPAAEATAEQTQDEIITELKDAVAAVPAYKSVTANEKIVSNYTGEAIEGEESGPDTIESVAVYQFDASGDKLKTHMTATVSGNTLEYYSDGDDAVFVSDGPIYSGTIEQFGHSHFGGCDAYLNEIIGDLNKLIDCAASVAKEQQGDTTTYTLVLDPRKYIDSDEALKALEASGDPIQNAVIAIGFDSEGRIVQLNKKTAFPISDNDVSIALSDFDTTSIDPMPEATNTYEELEKDREAKFNTLDAEETTSDESKTE